jgi:superoxide dismutase, Cu-Zn family
MKKFEFRKTSLVLTVIGTAGLMAFIGCVSDSNTPAAKTAMASMVTTGTGGARGTVNFTKVAGGVHVVASFQGLPPGIHGFHVHDKGSCDSAGVAAGGHFNPLAATAHGLPDSTVHHMGDMGNITAGADSMASLDHVYSYLTLDSVNTVVGHALIIHALPDLGTQPTGGAGGRISCGIVMTGM